MYKRYDEITEEGRTRLVADMNKYNLNDIQKIIDADYCKKINCYKLEEHEWYKKKNKICDFSILDCLRCVAYDYARYKKSKEEK